MLIPDDENLLEQLDNLSDIELERLTKMLNIKEISDRINKTSFEVAKMNIETAKLQAETAKIQQEMKYYPYLTAGATAIFLFILNFLAKKFGLV